MRNEIGSEFHIENTTEKAEYTVFDYLEGFNTKYFDSGRSALRALLKDIEHKRVLLPGYMCESVRDCFSDSEVLYYNIDSQFNIVWDDLNEKAKDNIDVVYLHFFNGCILPEYDFQGLKKAKELFGFTIIEDTTHSFLTKRRTVGDYCICSLRKWFPIACGGVLYSDKTLLKNEYNISAWSKEKRAAMLKKALYLKGENIEKNEFLSLFENSEKNLDTQDEIYAISEESFNSLRCLDLKNISAVRKNNFDILSGYLKKSGISVVAGNGINQIPLFCIIKTDKRNELRRYLINNDIFCPIHWPLYDELEKIEETVNNQAQELSIPIDQRYGRDDMVRIAGTIKEYVSCVF